MPEMNAFSRAFVCVKRALVPFIAKVKGVVTKNFLGALPPDPLKFSHFATVRKYPESAPGERKWIAVNSVESANDFQGSFC